MGETSARYSWRPPVQPIVLKILLAVPGALPLTLSLSPSDRERERGGDARAKNRPPVSDGNTALPLPACGKRVGVRGSTAECRTGAAIYRGFPGVAIWRPQHGRGWHGGAA